ncbi:hypothetical protein GCM10009864_74330 [Streptomyces lunalinharesii]|uniref:Uncharacterized protein n=1 Tax=Streptomyces lunalinharesii TaxID=333384 RepID=A0ABP6FCH4_9ACTN
MLLLRGHAVNSGLGGEGDDGEAAIGGGGLTSQEPVHGLAYTGAFALVLGSCEVLGRLGGGVVGVGHGAEPVGVEPEAIAQGAGCGAGELVDLVSAFAELTCVRVGVDSVAAALLAGLLPRRGRIWNPQVGAAPDDYE